ncbi:Cinnamate beta-D-glucosyltransferase [Capsicum annuum]|uniref:Glycosyltransferase n=1 Tax=Capsicum annuum TaxID=4072 RepID=C6ZRH7_CAPAN|nr:limonoid UDP-glucosyltransferase-like [Capsicum annuum]ACM41589.1 UDP-glucosyltransferase 1 [Capsicum annuum]KAF3643772.1 Cinnamate beta-D-glucosyltransferase [Capsicum annuum]
MGSKVSEGALVHAFLVSFPGQGHVKPLIRLAKRLASKGLLVTFSAPESFGAEMKGANPKISCEPTPYGSGMMRFDFFEDEWDHSKPDGNDLELYLQHLELMGKKILPKMIKKYAEQGSPVSCLINNPFIPWVCDVAESLGIPSAMLWVQSAASFSAYYHHSHSLVPFPSESQPEIDVQVPCMPLLKYDEVPSFLHPSSPYTFLKTAILGQFKNISKLTFILMETFQELEQDVVNYLSKKFPIKTVGPLFKYPKELGPTSSDVQGDFMKVENCIDWLDAKSPSSVVYISFGSVVILKKEQAEEIAYGLLNSGVNFLWVIRPPTKLQNFDSLLLPSEFLEKAGDRAKIVQWCPQEQVLSHPSVACFVTHCGWNSTLEALSSGMPVLAFPQWGDQVTDAKYIVDVFKIGLGLCRGESENRIIPREEVEKRVREAMNGPKTAELKENALKWKKKAEEAVAAGGSSERNLQTFVDYVRSV